eukprot:365400-Chlamydomonas_euryale.AAC.8
MGLVYAVLDGPVPDRIQALALTPPHCTRTRPRSDSRTILHVAATEGSVHAVKILLEAGADLLAQDCSGRIPLDDAERARAMPVVEILKPLTDEVRRQHPTSSLYQPTHATLKQELALFCLPNPSSLSSLQRLRPTLSHPLLALLPPAPAPQTLPTPPRSPPSSACAPHSPNPSSALLAFGPRLNPQHHTDATSHLSARVHLQARSASSVDSPSAAKRRFMPARKMSALGNGAP